MKKIFKASADGAGALRVRDEDSARLGLVPGATVYYEIGDNGQILMHKPVSLLSRIYVEPTNMCNLSCSTCIRHSWQGPKGFMEADTFRRILDVLSASSPKPDIFFGGFGEPLFHPRILDMVRQAKERGASAELITNGILLDEAMLEGLVDAGLDFLWVSLDGATPEGYADVRLADEFGGIIENVKRLRMLKYVRARRKPELGIVFVVMKRSLKDLPSVMDIADRLGASRFLMTNVLPYSKEMKEEILYGRGMWNWKYHLNRIDVPRMDGTPEVYEGLKRLFGRYELPDWTGGSFSVPYDTCPFVEKGSLSVRFDGEVSPCLSLLHNHESYLGDTLRKVGTRTFGSVREKPLLEIWRSETYTRFREQLFEFDFSPCSTCNSCEWAEGNEEDCFGSEFAACGGCLWAQGFIRCP